MSLKSRLAMLQIATAMIAMDPTAKRVKDDEPDFNNDGALAEQRHLENLKKKGVQEFHIDGEVIYARNYKNALKKASYREGEKMKQKFK